MADNKEYISRQEELGDVHISEDVIAVIAAVAASEVEGVGGLSANLGVDIAELLGKKNLSRGIKITIEENSITVDVSILVKCGFAITSVAKSVQEAVASNLEAMTGLTIKAVNVQVSGVLLDREDKAGTGK